MGIENRVLILTPRNNRIAQDLERLFRPRKVRHRQMFGLNIVDRAIRKKRIPVLGESDVAPQHDIVCVRIVCHIIAVNCDRSVSDYHIS